MKTEKSGWITVIDVLIYALLMGMVLYAFFRPLYYILQIAVIAVAAAIAFAFVWRTVPKPVSREEREAVAKVILLDSDGERVKEWLIQGETALLIGKSSSRGEVDIDLSDSEYASLVSPEHAVMNRVGALWYIEDAESQSGTGIRPSGKSSLTQLVDDKPHPVGPGDMIYIANTRLLVK